MQQRLKIRLYGNANNRNSKVEQIEPKVGKENTKLIQTFIEKTISMPFDYSDSRLLSLVSRLTKICELLDKKPLNSLEENDLMQLNRRLKEGGYESANYYRKVLKQFWRTLDEKKYFDLIKSPLLKNPREKLNGKKTVDADKFWSADDCARYLSECKKDSPQWAAFGAILLSCGLRPHEQLALTKEAIAFEEMGRVAFKVNSRKTGKRTIVLFGKEAETVKAFVQPFLDGLKAGEKLFSQSYEAIRKKHFKLAKRAGISEKKDYKLYNHRRMVLTRWYDELGVVRAAAMCGHVQGSNSMKAYVGLSESALRDEPLPRVASRPCPACGFEGTPAEQTACQRCNNTLDASAFRKAIQRNAAELVQTQMALFKSEMRGMLLEMLANAKTGG